MIPLVGTHVRHCDGSRVRVLAEQLPPNKHNRRRFIVEFASGSTLTVTEDELSALPPTARTSDPGTSHKAATRAAIKAESNKALLLIAHAEAGSRGLTGDEIETATGKPYQSIGPRRPALEEAGLVRKAIGDNGRLVERNDKQVYVITPMGDIEANRLKKEAS